MDKIGEENSLPSNLPWFFKCNMKIEERKSAGSFDRLSKKQTHKQKYHKPTTLTESLSQEARKEAEPGTHAGELCRAEESHRGLCSGNASSIAQEEPRNTPSK